MLIHFKRTAAAIGATVCVTGAVAQQALDPNTVVNAGVQVARLLDEGRYAEVWDGASVVTRKAVARAEFVRSVAQARRAIGALATDRTWIDVSRRDVTEGVEPPPGLYMSVEYRTRFANGKGARELISFRRDEDQNWRVTGYVIK